jgi:hypothetical protein
MTTVNQARARALAAAKQNGKKILDAITQQTGLLEDGQVPEASFMASVLKYEQARDRLLLLDQISDGDTGEDDGMVLVSRDDLVPVLRLMGGSSNPDSPLRRLEDIAEPWRDTSQDQEEQA